MLAMLEVILLFLTKKSALFQGSIIRYTKICVKHLLKLSASVDNVLCSKYISYIKIIVAVKHAELLISFHEYVV